MSLSSIPLNPSQSSQETNTIYTDAYALSDLKLQAQEDQDKALPEVAKQFESIFIGMMLKSARQASLGDALVSSSAIDTFQDMSDKQMSIELSKGKGFGIADSIVAQLKRENLSTQEPEINPDGSLSLPVRRSFYHNYEEQIKHREEVIANAERKEQVKTEKADAIENSGNNLPIKSKDLEMITFESSQEFVDKLWPMAEKAAKDLGVSTGVLVSQAALETGWGQSILATVEKSSHNLFNIKADSRWEGEKISKESLEYENNIAVNKTSHFRSYSNYQDSFNDYVKFIKENPRYGEALQKVNNSEQYLHGIHQAGYATDPNYVEKIMKVLNGSNIQNKLSRKT
jgi:flagellar protein FlgJ